MLKYIANIPIFRRLFYAFLLAAIIPGIVITILGFVFISAQNARNQALQTSINAAQASAQAGGYLQDLKDQPHLTAENWSGLNSSSLRTRLSQISKYIHQQENLFESALTNYRTNYQIQTSPQMGTIRAILLNDDPTSPLPGEQEQLLNKISKELWPGYKNAQNQLLTHLANNKAPITPVYNTVEQKYTALWKAWGQVENLAGKVSTKVVQGGPSQINPILLATVVAFFSTVMVVFAIGYIVSLTITRPLRQLASLTKRIAKGETTARAIINGQDEIYMVANSMNNMLDNIVRLIQETQSQRDWLQAQVEKLVSEVSGVGEGDLRVQAEVTADALGVLADSFNYMVEELGSLVVRVKLVASEVERSTATILDRMTQLVESEEAQQHHMQEAAREVKRMTAASHQVAERAQGLYEVARVARHDAQLGRESVTQAVEGMGRINTNVQQTASKVQTLGERSREINDIVEVISGIAHQTNRLALDAAIQAAMAGENGKGFGAVAADIRRLAERAKDQSSMIVRIVRNVREEIGAVAVSMQDTERETASGSKLTQEAGMALESIFAAVEHQAREIEHINKMAVQQLQSSSAVVSIMQGVSETTQQNTLNTRQASQNVERLSRLVEQLRASVEAFKLRENRNYLVPNTSVNPGSDDEEDTPLTVSGVFRTVSATAKSVQGTNKEATANTLLPESDDPFSIYPKTPQHLHDPNTAWDWDSTPYEEQVQPSRKNKFSL
jgi:methyl-accepting chemotaxis protein